MIELRFNLAPYVDEELLVESSLSTGDGTFTSGT